MIEKTPTLNYARPIEPLSGEALFRQQEAFRKLSMIYCFGVGVIWLVLIGIVNSWPHTSNSLDPLKAELDMYRVPTGGAAIAWLVLGIRRILQSRLARQNVLIWLVVFAIAFAGLFVIPTNYM